MRTLCVIPARYHSTRLPGKPLADVAGKPMIVRVYERATMARLVAGVIVATDDERILNAVEEHGGYAMMTSKDHPTGTDRLAEVARVFPDMDLIINVQGDEPLIDPDVIDSLVAAFEKNDRLEMATVITPIDNEAEIKNPNNVKVVIDSDGYALYFSRSPIPFDRNVRALPVYKHIGIYAYRRTFLIEYAKMEPTPLERTESLEQLRALENGRRIMCVKSNSHFVGVDTAEDLMEVNRIYKELNIGGGLR